MSDEAPQDVTSPRQEQDRQERELERLLSEAKAKHKRAIGWLDDEYGPLVFHKPGKADWARFVAEVTAENADQTAATENLVLACAYFPSRPQMAAIVDDRPAMANQVGNELRSLASASGQARGKGSR